MFERRIGSVLQRRVTYVESGRPAARWGVVVYRVLTAIAVVLAVLAVLSSFYNVNAGRVVVAVPALLFAALVWLIGRGCRYLMTH
ncbi:MAG TPA: hypothetical protein VFA57_01025 [Pseudolabrys sp.]|nr:hypothetical protein [Pseudolabrys sp.]